MNDYNVRRPWPLRKLALVAAIALFVLLLAGCALGAWTRSAL